MTKTHNRICLILMMRKMMQKKKQILNGEWRDTREKNSSASNKYKHISSVCRISLLNRMQICKTNSDIEKFVS